MPERETTILDYIYTIVKWWKFIFIFTLTVGVITAGITLTLTKWYRATATIIISQEQSELSILTKLSTIPYLPFGGALDINTQSQQYLAILDSRIAQEFVAERYSLQKQYKTSNLEETTRILRSHVDFGLTDQGCIYINVEDTSPVQASEMANAYVHFLDSINIKNQTEQARNNRQFIQDRLDSTEIQLQAAEDSLESFQKLNDIFSIPEQVAAGIKSYAELFAQKVAKEIELETIGMNLSKDHPARILLENEINSIQKRLDAYEKKPELLEGAEDNAAFFLPFAESPRLEKEYVRLKREVEKQNAIYTILTEQVEQAKIQEARDTPTLLPLDEAVPPERRSKPRRTITVLIMSALAFIFAMVLTFSFEYINRVQSSSPAEQEKLQAIRRLISRKPKGNE
ncbi:hypothetical protein AMJ80_02600 [bacterium SM23_31]|nr:MAG: hypothetical protein AMJ80_02600 [bacterium SM23_31]